MKGMIFNIQKFSIHDGPGIRTTIFFKGCNLRCKWCANPESQCGSSQLTWDSQKCIGCGRCADACPAHARIFNRNSAYPITDTKKCTLCLKCSEICPAGAIKTEGTEYTEEEIIAEVLKDKAFYDTSGGGVTLSGGEIFLQKEFAVQLCRRLHQEGVSVAIETAAHVPAEVFSDFIKNVDFIFVDLKHYCREKHQQGTGVGNEQIIENIRMLPHTGLPFIVRIPVIPGFNDSLNDAHGFGRLLKELGIHQVQLLPFHQMGELKYTKLGKDYDFQGLPGLHREDLEPYKEVLKNYIEHIQIGG